MLHIVAQLSTVPADPSTLSQYGPFGAAAFLILTILGAVYKVGKPLLDQVTAGTNNCRDAAMANQTSAATLERTAIILNEALKRNEPTKQFLGA